MELLHADDLKIEVDTAIPGLLRLNWLGKSSSREPAKVVRAYLLQALAYAGNSSSSLDMHFEHLEYFNSSTVAEIIFLINAARERRVPLNIYYDRTLKWQALSFGAIERAIKPFETGGQNALVRVVAQEAP